MKILLGVALFSLLGLADSQQLKVDSSTSLRIYNHRPNIQLQHQQKLRRLSKIKPDAAKQIARKACNAKEISYLKLKYKGQLLFYRITTKHCVVEINALDGAVISKTVNHPVNTKEQYK